MLVLDTDHLRVLMKHGPQTPQLVVRLKASEQDVTTTVINVVETLEGWITEINRNKTASGRQGLYYNELYRLMQFYSGWTVLPFDEAAIARFEELQRRKLRSIGPEDLKIAAIVLSRNAVLLSANLRHFRLVSELNVEDWIH